MSRADAEEWAKAVSKDLRGDDSRFANSVQVVYYTDGSTLFYRYAFVLIVQSEDEPEENTIHYYCVFTEHHGFLVVSGQDARVRQYGPEVKIEVYV